MQQHSSSQRLGFYSSAFLHQGMLLPDELAGLGAGHLEELFCSGGQLCRTGGPGSLHQLACCRSGGLKNNSPFVQQLDIRLL
ncbi:hypothetical protein D3C86_2020150 [compost metagenome]